MTSYVGLNVGGKIYSTSCTTLTREPDSFFPLLLSGRVPSEKDAEGNYRIDCDGKIFRHVLNYMRYGELVLPDGFSEYELLQRQAEFFQLESLQSLMKEERGKLQGIVGKIGLNVDGQIYHLTKEGAEREPDSFFSSMLREDSFVPKDAHGNFIIDSQDKFIIEILRYLYSGDVFRLVLSRTTYTNLSGLTWSAKQFGLKALCEHIEGLSNLSYYISQHSRDRLFIIMYCFAPDDYIIYARTIFVSDQTFLPFREDDMHTIRTSDRAVKGVQFKLDETHFDKQVTVHIDGRQRTFNYPRNQEELIDYIKERTGADRTTRTKQKLGCTKIEFRYDGNLRIV